MTEGSFLTDTVLSLLAFLAVYLLPGYLINSIVRWRKKLPEALPAVVYNFTGSFLVLALLSLVYFSGGSRFEDVVRIYFGLAGAGLAVFLLNCWRGGIKPKVETLTRKRSSLEITFLVVLFLSLITVYWIKGRIGGDYPYHLAGVRKIAYSSYYFPSRMWGRFDSPPFVGYKYPILHFSIAVSTRISTLDPVIISYYLPVYLFVVAVFVWYALAQVISGEKSFAFATAACFCLFQTVLMEGRAVQMILVPAFFSDLLFLPLLLAFFFLLFHPRPAKPLGLLCILPLLAEIQLCLHASQWFYFLLIAAGFSLLALVFSRERAPGGWLLITFALVLGCAVPIIIKLSRAIPLDSLKGIFEIERDFFRRYRWGMGHRLGRIECLRWPNVYIVNRSLIFTAFTIPCFLYIFSLLRRSVLSKLEVYLMTTTIIVILVQLNPLVLHYLPRFLHFTTAYRMSGIIPVPLFFVAISLDILAGGDRGKSIAARVDFWPRHAKWLGGLVLTGLAYALYKYILAPLSAKYLPLIQFYLMPLVALVLLYKFFRAGWRRARGGQSAGRPIRRHPTASQLYLLLLFFSPLIIQRAVDLGRSGLQLKMELGGGALEFVTSQIKPKSVFISNNKYLSIALPTYTDNYSYVGWQGSSPGFGMSVPDRVMFANRIFGEKLEDRERYDLLRDREIDYLLVSIFETQVDQDIFQDILKSRYLKKVFSDGEIYILEVLDPEAE